MKDFTEQIERIKLKLKKAKETDSEFKVFGAKSHQYEIGKPVDASVVEEFELNTFRAILSFFSFAETVGD